MKAKTGINFIFFDDSISSFSMDIFSGGVSVKCLMNSISSLNNHCWVKVDEGKTYKLLPLESDMEEFMNGMTPGIRSMRKAGADFLSSIDAKLKHDLLKGEKMSLKSLNPSSKMLLKRSLQSIIDDEYSRRKLGIMDPGYLEDSISEDELQSGKFGLSESPNTRFGGFDISVQTGKNSFVFSIPNFQELRNEYSKIDKDVSPSEDVFNGNERIQTRQKNFEMLDKNINFVDGPCRLRTILREIHLQAKWNVFSNFNFEERVLLKTDILIKENMNGKSVLEILKHLENIRLIKWVVTAENVLLIADVSKRKKTSAPDSNTVKIPVSSPDR